MLSYVPALNMGEVIATPTTAAGENPVAGLEAELEEKNARLDQLWKMSNLRGAQAQIEAASAEIEDLEKRLIAARKNVNMVEAEAASPNRMGQLLQMVVLLSLPSGEELRTLRLKLGQELRRVIEVIRLSRAREVSVELKPMGGYQAVLTVHHDKGTGRAVLRGAVLVDAQTGEAIDIPGELIRAATYEFLVNV